jgi:dienelactone hydrolase
MLDNRKLRSLQPATLLWSRCNPASAPLRFRARSRSAALAWQKTVRRELAATLGFQDLPRVTPQPKRLERVDKGDYVREKVLLRTSAHSQMPVYLLIPKSGRKPLPTVLAFHGHGYGVKDIVGLWEDGTERTTPDGYHKDFAVALCRAGFAVAAPEIACFGERQTDFSYLDSQLGQGNPGTCTHSAMLAFHQGASVLGMRVADGRRLVDYLETRPEFDTGRLGAMGISGGGMHTFYSTCLDARIKACVVSGYYSTFKESVLAMSHCACNFVPGLARFGEMYDLVGLVAPRPMLVEAGTRDPIFPIAAVRRSVARAQAVYHVLGVENGVQTDVFEGRHQISGRKAYGWLTDRLASHRR